MRTLSLLLLAVMLLATASAEIEAGAEAESEGLDCVEGWTRADAHECCLRHADDVNEDGKLDAREVSAFKKKLINHASFFGSVGGWVESKIEELAPHNWLGKYSTEEIMHRCGDEQGFITLRSWKMKHKHCLNRCPDVTNFMHLCRALDAHKVHYPHHKIDKLGNHMIKEDKRDVESVDSYDEGHSDAEIESVSST